MMIKLVEFPGDFARWIIPSGYKKLFPILSVNYPLAADNYQLLLDFRKLAIYFHVVLKKIL